MSTTRSNWTSDHPRFVMDLNGDGRADVLGIGPDCVWSCLNGGPTGLGAPTFQLVALEANSGWRTGDHPRFLADLTGDGRPDLVGFGDAGVWTACGNGDGSFRPVAFVLDEFGFNKGWSFEFPRFVADLTGDGRADLVGFGKDGIWTALSNGDGSFQSARMVSADLAFNAGWRVEKHPRFVTDLTGDGRADILGFGDDGAWVVLGNGDGGFQGARFVLAELGFDQGWRVDRHPRFLADLTGDGRPDLVGFGDAGIWVALNSGDGSFQPARFVSTDFGFNTGWRVDRHPRFVADLTGDGMADIIGFGDDGIWVALGNGDGSFQPARMVSADFSFNTGWRVDDHPRFLADMDGDGKVDIVGFGDDGLWIARNRGDGGFDAASFVLADFGRHSNHDLVVRREIITDHRNQGRIKHLFVLMLENRSYDHLLGFAGISGTDAATGQPTTADGLTNAEFNCFAGERVFVSRGAPDVTVAPGHDFPDALAQLCGPNARYPSGGPYPEVNNTGFAASLRSGEVMRCFKPKHLPILTRLAGEFAVCDRWFCSMPGPTEPNRYFLHAASSADYDESPSPAKLAEASTNPFGGIDFEGGNIFDALDDADVETRIYAGDNFPVVGELEGVSNTIDIRDFENLAEDLQDPDFDAGFIHIEPKYFDGLGDTIHHNFGSGNSQHPLGGIAAGERLIKATYEAIRNSPHWESSMLIVTYDEHGGFYDHVPPGPAKPTGSKGSQHGFMFDQLGARVPAVVISPLIPKGTIEHRLLEHCSVLKTVCQLFNVPFLQRARDLHSVCGLLHLASLLAPRTDTPARLPPVVVSDFKPAPPSPGGDDLTVSGGALSRAAISATGAASPAGGTPGVTGLHPAWVHGDFTAGFLGRPLLASNPPDSMVATTLRVAAIRNMALEPQRKAEITARVVAIKTGEEAVAYIKEVDAKLNAAGRSLR